MTIFSYHLVNLSLLDAAKKIFVNPISKKTPGLIHSEYMTAMTLGSAVFSTSRVLIGKVAIFMQWENESSLDDYLNNTHFGKIMSKGWHVRLSFLRQWGRFSHFQIPSQKEDLEPTNSVVVAVTIAKMKPFSVPRFIRWGRPVEKLVRDHPEAIFSLASVKFPNTVSTFSIWKSVNGMTDMVLGHSHTKKPKRHLDAMNERERKNFHFEFTTLRFKPLGEYGSWESKTNFIPITEYQKSNGNSL